MALSHSPSIVTDGLVLYLDAANRKSYPGTGTAWGNLTTISSTGTLENNPTYSTVNLGNFSFDGTDDRVLISCNNSTIRTFNSSTHFVVKLPVYSGGQRCILSYRTGVGAGDLYIGKISSGIFCYYNQLSNPATIYGNIVNDTTVIVTITCDATNNLLNTYINGSLAGSASRTGWVSSYHTSFYLGWDPGGTNEYMLGNFYQFAHYAKVLSLEEIQQNFNALRGRFGI